MSAPDSFVEMATRDLMGKPKPTGEELNEASKKASPAMHEFVQMAVRDLQGQPVESKEDATKKIQENKDELEEAFNKSIGGRTAKDELKEKFIEDFQQEAGKEAEEALAKLLKGIR